MGQTHYISFLDIPSRYRYKNIVNISSASTSEITDDKYTTSQKP